MKIIWKLLLKSFAIAKNRNLSASGQISSMDMQAGENKQKIG